jgi:hypothetical protein
MHILRATPPLLPGRDSYRCWGNYITVTEPCEIAVLCVCFWTWYLHRKCASHFVVITFLEAVSHCRLVLLYFPVSLQKVISVSL